MLDRVVSGGQTGVDQAALRAVKAAGIATGGWAPLGWQTEQGPCPELASLGLVECPEPGYPAPTRANVRDADGTVWFGSIDSAGFRCTYDTAVEFYRPLLIVHPGITRPSDVADWIQGHGVRTLNVAGNRESVSPGIGAKVEAFLAQVFRATNGAG